MSLHLRASEWWSRRGESVADDINAPPKLADPSRLPSSLQPSSVGGRAASGALWFLGQMAASRGMQLLTQVALSWLLLPKDFGAVGLTYTVTTIVGALFSFGVGDVLLQRQKTLHLWLPQAFWLSLGAGCSSAAVVLAVSPVAAAAYHTPELTALAAVMAVSMPLTALSTVPSAILRANLNFRAIALVTLFETLALQSLTLIFAWWGMAAFSFIVPVPIVALGRTAILWHLARPIKIARPRLPRFKFLIANALAVTGVYLSVGIVQQGDYVVLGIVSSSSTVVGLYYFSYRIAVQPLQMLAGSFGNVLFPALSRLHSNLARQHAAALKVCDMISLIVTPACFLQAALAGPFLHLFFPSRWIGAIPIIQILSIGLAFDAVSWAAGPLLHARGEFKRSFRYATIQVLIFFPLVGIGAWLGSAIGVAIGVATFYAIVGPAYTYLIFRPMGVRLREIADIYVVPLALSAAIIGSAFEASQYFSAAPIAQACITIGFAVPIYTLVAWYIRPDSCRELLIRLRELIGSKIPKLGSN
jgi:O-antigen/teichoic acid export membrane protein